LWIFTSLSLSRKAAETIIYILSTAVVASTTFAYSIS